MKYSESSTTIIQKVQSDKIQHIDFNSNSKKSILNSEAVCKLCLIQMAENQIFQACICRGSLGVVHQSCLIQWLSKRKDIEQIKINRVAICQICKGQIKMFCKWKIQCSSIGQFKLSLFQKGSATILLVMIQIVLCIGWMLTFLILPQLKDYWIYWVIAGISILPFYALYHLIKFQRYIYSIVKNQTKSRKVIPVDVQIVDMQSFINYLSQDKTHKQQQ